MLETIFRGVFLETPQSYRQCKYNIFRDVFVHASVNQIKKIKLMAYRACYSFRKYLNFILFVYRANITMHLGWADVFNPD